jgi:hypothetical protein
MVVVTHTMLWEKRRKGLIRGNWRVLSGKEKALYSVSLAYTKPRWELVWLNGRKHKIDVGRTIVETRLVQKLEELFVKLLETRGMRILKRGQAKASALLYRLEQTGAACWLVGLKDWLKDPAYLFWLGAVG